ISSSEASSGRPHQIMTSPCHGHPTQWFTAGAADDTPKFKKPRNHGDSGASLWRYRWDLNPRWAFTHTTFRELHLRPLGHGTADDLTRTGKARGTHQNVWMPRAVAVS